VKLWGRLERAKKREKRHFLVTTSLKPGHVLAFNVAGVRDACIEHTKVTSFQSSKGFGADWGLLLFLAI
jgi:hypothetical protein